MCTKQFTERFAKCITSWYAVWYGKCDTQCGKCVKEFSKCVTFVLNVLNCLLDVLSGLLFVIVGMLSVLFTQQGSFDGTWLLSEAQQKENGLKYHPSCQESRGSKILKVDRAEGPKPKMIGRLWCYEFQDA